MDPPCGTVLCVKGDADPDGRGVEGLVRQKDGGAFFPGGKFCGQRNPMFCSDLRRNRGCFAKVLPRRTSFRSFVAAQHSAPQLGR